MHRWEAVWPITDDTMCIDDVKAQALADLPDLAAEHGHLWFEGTPVEFTVHDGYESHVVFFPGLVLVARTVVKTRTRAAA